MSLKFRTEFLPGKIDHVLLCPIVILVIFLLRLSSTPVTPLALDILSEESLLAKQPKDTVPDFGPDGLKGLTEEQKKELFAGNVILVSSPETSPGGQTLISAVLLFKAPLDRVWAILSATEKQIEYLEEIEKLTLVEKGSDFNRMKFVVKVIGKRVVYTVIHHFMPEKYYFWWELDKKARHDLKELSGFWRLYPAGENRTVARYGSCFVPDFPAPEFIRDWLSRKSVGSSLEKVKRYVEEMARNL